MAESHLLRKTGRRCRRTPDPGFPFDRASRAAHSMGASPVIPGEVI
jgi:hypothetical protein